MSIEKAAIENPTPRGTGVTTLTHGKDERLSVLSVAPIVLETPHSLLAENPVTPKPILFVRNVQHLPEQRTPEPSELADWEIALGGLIDQPVTIRGADLLGMDQVEHEMVLQCSGNGRAKFSEAFPISMKTRFSAGKCFAMTCLAMAGVTASMRASSWLISSSPSP